jgi:diguanylate cyclase (GGDEF)-like protein/PAS domain S-box-containing protein
MNDVKHLHYALDSLDVYVFTLDVKQNFTYINQKMCDLFTLPSDEILGKHHSSFADLDIFDMILEGAALVIEQQQQVNKNEVPLTISAGALLYFNIDKKPLINALGETVGMMIVMEDVTSKRVTEEKLENSIGVLQVLAKGGEPLQQNIFHLIVEQLAISQGAKFAVIAQIDPSNSTQLNTVAVWANGEVIDNFSYSLVGTPCGEVLGDNVCVFECSVQQLFPLDTMLEEMHAQSYVGVPLYDSNKNVTGLMSILDDKPMHRSGFSFKLLESLAARVSIELERLSNDVKLQLYSRTFNATHEGIVVTDKNVNIIDVNPAFTHITGYSKADVLGKKPKMLRSVLVNDDYHETRLLEIETKGSWQGEVWGQRKNGESFAHLLNITTIRNLAGEITNYIGLFSDITQTKRQQEELIQLAHYDSLTKLANRTLLAERFIQAVDDSHKNNKKMALCFIDLDEFKSVNDKCGHQAGDKLLVAVSERINALVRDGDTVSRQGGDEFALLINNVDSDQQCKIILDSIHQSLARPYKIDEHIHHISASCGVTLYPDDNGDFDTLLRHADQAMYQAKLSGRNRYYFFNPEQDQQVTYKKNRIDEIKRALLNNEFQLFYQPKVNMSTADVYGVEALIRWFHPEKGMIPPLDFLPAIQGSELELDVGNWVIESAIQQFSTWYEQGLTIEVSINISSNQILSDNFVSSIQQLINKYKLEKPECIQFEILESAALSDISSINKVINQCQEVLGLSVALDDFGTGYSSLTHLRNLSADTVKIDRSFVRDVLDDPSDSTIIEGILSLANAFNRKVIAEGVETKEHGLMLLLMGCQNAQGYGIAKPMPADEVLSWKANYQPDMDWLMTGQFDSTYKERKLAIFKLIINQWKQKFLDKVLVGLDNKKSWPILNTKKCACGIWLSRAKQEQLLLEEGLEQLNEAHNDFHDAAEHLLNDYHAEVVFESGDITTQLEGVTQQLHDLLLTIK